MNNKYLDSFCQPYQSARSEALVPTVNLINVLNPAHVPVGANNNLLKKIMFTVLYLL